MDTLKTWCAPLLLIFMAISAVAQPKPDKWSGMYINRESGLILKIQEKADGMYPGEFILGQQSFSMQGFTLLGVFNGAYSYQGQNFGFTLTPTDNKWILSVDGVTVEVEKKPLKDEAGTVQAPEQPDKAVAVPEKEKGPVSPASGTRKTDQYAGYSFALPAGWACKETGEGFHLTKAGEKAELVVAPHFTPSVQQALAESNQPVNDANSQTYLTPVSKPYGNNGVQVSITGQAQGKPFSSETISLMSPHGNGGVSFTAISVAGSASSYLPQLKSMAASATFMVPKAHPQAAAWKQKLTGKKLLYLKTEGGGTTKISIDLYQDGSYSYSYQSSYSSGGYADFSYADKDEDRGQWQIVSRGNEIILLGNSSQKGGSTAYVLSSGQNNGEVMLDNRRYFIQNL
jgi:hypothetical protein